MKKALSDQVANNPTQFNIEAIAKLEEEALHGRTSSERASDAIVKFIGSMTFLLLHALLVAAWSMVNLNLIPRLRPFDPFPFGILALLVSSESVFLTIFVLISQNRFPPSLGRSQPLPSLLGREEPTTLSNQKLCCRLPRVMEVESPLLHLLACSCSVRSHVKRSESAIGQ